MAPGNSPGRLVVWSWLLLAGWQVTWHLLLPEPSGNRSAWLAALAALPLVALAPGILGNRERSRYWSMFLVMLYLVIGIVEAWANPPQRVAALVQVALCLAYVAGLLRISPRFRR
ncbi:MAG: DUF2069 domain-containing protein [Xanthomonadales bacterium]|nr:DUF2069 domain-containing protein [Xanthomonadales bacterium]